MEAVLVDSNVLRDVATSDPMWGDWSAEALERTAEATILVINPLAYAGVSIGFDAIEDLEAALPIDLYRREEFPYEAGFLAGKCFLRYRRAGGSGDHRCRISTSARMPRSLGIDYSPATRRTTRRISRISH